MLEGLDQVDWAQLDHAYGPAVDVPDMLRSLASPDEDEYKRAASSLFGSICHQGTIYPATAQAAPFLIELLGYPEVHPRVSILNLLNSSASGSGFFEVHGSLDFFRKERETEEFAQAVAEEMRTARAAFDAVAQGTQIYLRLLQDSDPEVRGAAAKLLPYCADQSPEVAARLQAQVDAERLPVLKAEMLKPLLRAWLAPGFRPEQTRALSAGEADYLTALMRSADEPIAVRMSAASWLMQLGHNDLANETLSLFDQGIRQHSPGNSAQQSIDPSSVMFMARDAFHAQPRELLNWLIGYLSSPDEAILTSALFKIERLCCAWRWASPAAAPHIAPLLKSGSEKTRQRAAAAFSRMGRTAGVAAEALRQVAEEEDPGARPKGWATTALRRLADEGRRYAVETLLDEYPASDAPIPEMIEKLKAFVEEDYAAHKDGLPILRALELHQAAARQAIPWLEKVLDFSDSRMRAYAARALWAIDGPGHTDAILASFRTETLDLTADYLLVIDCLRQMGQHARPMIPTLDEVARGERRCDSDVWLDEALQELAEQALTSIPGGP